MRTRVAKLLDSYLDRTIGAAADEEDDNLGAGDGKVMMSGVSTETEEDEGFRLFVDSRPGSIVVGEGKKRKVEVEVDVTKKEESDSEAEEEERKKIESVVVEVEPPSES